MESISHQTTILNIESVELHRTVNDETSLVKAGRLHVVYFSANNSFALKIDDFAYTLSKLIVVQALIPRDEEAYPSYILPNDNDGYYTLRIVKIASPEALSTLETLFNNHCMLAYENEPAPKLEQAKEMETKDGSSTKPGLFARVVSYGGELSKTGMIKSAELIASGISKAGDFVQRKYIKNPEEKEVSNMTMYKLKAANLATSMTKSATAIPAQGIVYAGKQVTKQVGDKIFDTKLGNKHHDTIAEVGNSALYATACIYDGFTEALAIFGNGVAETTTKLVTQKYGGQVGNATKEGMTVIGNVASVINMFKNDAVRVIEEHAEGRTN